MEKNSNFCGRQLIHSELLIAQAVFRAIEISCNLLLKGLQVDYICYFNSLKYPDAFIYHHITYYLILNDN